MMKLDEPNRLKVLPNRRSDDLPIEIINNNYPESPSIKYHLITFSLKLIIVLIFINILVFQILSVLIIFNPPSSGIFQRINSIQKSQKRLLNEISSNWNSLMEGTNTFFSWIQVVVSYLINPFQIFAFFVAIIIVIQLAKFRLPITRSVSFFPFILSWSSTVTIELQNAQQIGYRLHTFLKNNPKFTMRSWIYLGEPKNYLKISCSCRRFLIPFSTTTILARLHGFFLSYSIEVQPSSLPKTRFRYRTYHIKSTDSVPLLTPLITSLRNQRYSGLIVSTYQSKRKKSEDTPDDGLNYSTKLFVDRSKHFDINLIKATLESQVMNSKLSRFSWFSTKYVPEVQSRLILELPLIEELIKTHHQWDFENLPTAYRTEVIIGKVMRNEQVVGDFGISASDLRKGGVIAGAIGSGKTNMRLHIVNNLINAGVIVIDFDIKGDVPRYRELGEQGLTLIPKKNFWMNPFEKPGQYTDQEYSDMLLNSFLATIPDAELLTPPQLNLLAKSLTLTVKSRGNPRTFLRNMLLIAKQDQKIISNFQEITAHALITKFNWLQGSLKEVFWVSHSSHSPVDLMESSLFFDLSELKATSSITVIRFFIELFMMKVISWYTDVDPLLSDLPRLIVSIDEAQLLLPRRKSTKLTPIEEVVTTLRYKGLSILAAGVSAGKMSDVLLDTGFIAQYRSDSEELLRALGLSNDQRFLVSRLKPYHAIVRSDSTESRPVMVLVNQIGFQQLNSNQYHKILKSKVNSSENVPPKLKKFVISDHEIFNIKVLMELEQLLSISDLKFQQICQYLNRQYEINRVDISKQILKKDFKSIKTTFDNILGVDKSSEEYYIIAIYSLLDYLYGMSNKDQPLRLILRDYKDFIFRILSYFAKNKNV